MRLRDGPSLGSAALMGNEIICDLQHTSFLDLSDLAVDIQIGFELREREKKRIFWWSSFGKNHSADIDINTIKTGTSQIK